MLLLIACAVADLAGTGEENRAVGLFMWIILGWFVGLLANWIMGVKDRGNMIVSWLLGSAGALLAAFLGAAFGLINLSIPDSQSVLIAVGGSVVVLAAYRAVRGSLN
jgi:uncharacterized membrane protein YeaQ/YmgE (transglycosylase-associated protein family)